MILNRVPLMVMKQTLLLLFISCCCLFRAATQPLIMATDATSNHNEIVTLTVSVQHFTDILEFNYSVNWNPDVLEFVSFSEIGGMPGLNAGNFDTSGAPNGFFTTDWNDPTNDGVTLDDFTILYKMNFLVVGFPGTCSEVAFTSTPNPIVVHRVSSEFNIGLLRDNGKVTIPTPPCRAEDSLALVQLYDQANGPLWINPWTLSQPLDNWYGVIIGPSGCVEGLDLDGIPDGNYSPEGNGNNLVGTLPDLILPNLKKLYLSNNSLSGNIPPFMETPQLQDVALDNNQFQNCPEITSLSQLQYLHLQNNALTFEDIIPNINIASINFEYAPQALIYVPTTNTLAPGSSHIIDLDIDDSVTGSTYRWLKDNVDFTTTNNNQLQFNNVTINEEGIYTVKVTNPAAPDLTLCSHPVTVELDCPDNVVNLAASICSGGIYEVGDQSFDMSGFYEVHLLSNIGCDSVVHLSLNVNPPIANSLDETICAGASYTVGNSTFNTTGLYEVILQTEEGCDSLVRLDLEVLAPNQTFLNREICEGSSITIGSNTYDATGNYEATLMGGDGCDSTVYLELTVHTSVFTPIAADLCEGEIYPVGDTTLSTTGVHQIILPSGTGCDSIVEVNLSVHPVYEIFLVEGICEGDNYPMGGNTYSEPGNYEVFLITGAGCDSTVYLDLSVAEVLEEHLDIVICEGDSYEIGMETYTETGEYEGLLQSINGCDSMVYLNLEVAEHFTTHLVESICNGGTYTVGNSTYTEAGDYEDMLTTVHGCDSMVYLNLSITDAIYEDLDAAICEGGSYALGDSIFTQAGDYEVEFVATSGCDSIVQLHLAINDILETNLVEDICIGSSYPIGNQSFSETGSYEVSLQSVAGCDSIVYLDLTVLDIFEETEIVTLCEGEIYTVGTTDFNQTGSYTVPLLSAGGCDSIIHLELTIVDEATFGTAIAGGDLVTCNDIVQLTGNLREGAFGTWTTLEGAVIASPNDISTSVSNLVAGQNTFIWSLSTEDCPEFSSDELIVDFQSETPNVVDDTLEVASDKMTAFDVLLNDDLKNRTDWLFDLLPPADFGVAKSDTPGVVEYTPYRGFYGNTFFSYQLCNPQCPEYCAEANIWLKVETPDGAQPSIIITPNGDGLNETLIFDDLETFPDNEVVITNRWGSMVFKAKPYTNNWNGQNMSGQMLPEGTYYYMMQFDVAEGKYQVGSVTVKR